MIQSLEKRYLPSFLTNVIFRVFQVMSYITSLLLWCSLLTMAAAKTCHSMDVRNHVNNIKQLEGCHVIEGFLQVKLKSAEKFLAEKCRRRTKLDANYDV